MKHLLLVGFVLALFFCPEINYAQNTNPIAANDFVTVCENSGTVNVDVQNNDLDLEGNNLTTSIYFGPLNGTATLVGNNIDFTPNNNFNGNDTIYYVICDDGSPSLCDTGMVIITVNAAPIADAESDETICFGDSASIGTPGAMGVTYSWSPSTGLSSSTDPQPYASPVVPTTTYILTATNTSNGCQQRDTVIVTVNPLPVANAGPDHTACEGDSVMLGTPGTAGNTYYWSPIAPLNWNSLPQPMAAPATTTTFTLTVTTTATGCQSKDSVLVTIDPGPATNAGPDMMICNGDSVQIGSPAVAGNTYSWSPSTGLSSSTVAQPMASPSVTTTYTLTVTNSTSGCNDTNTVTVSIGTSPVANAGPNQSSCDGDSVLIGTPPVAGNTYSWSPIIGLASPNSAQTMASPAVTTTYTLTVTNATSGCPATDVVVVTVGTTPLANAGANQSICAGGSVTIGSPAIPGNSYSWTPVTGLSSATVAQPSASPAVTTTYILTVTQTASGCQDKDTVIVTVTPSPVANAGPNQISCNGDSVQIGTPAVAGNTYSWLPPTGLSSSTVADPMARPLVTTTYTLTVTNTATGCTSTDVVTVTVGAVPVANAGVDVTICNGDSMLIGTPAIPGNTYSWSPATGLSSATVAQPFASPTITTTYTVTVTNAPGCQASDAVIVTVNPLPVANAGPNQVACDGDSVQIGSPAVAGNVYVWSPATGLSSPVAAQPMARPLVTTSYTLTVTNSATGCQNTDVVIVTIGTAPVTNAGPDQNICEGDSVQIGTPAIPGNTYSWSPATGLSSTTIAQPYASNLTTTTYMLIVTNATGCSDTDSVTVFINPLPNADAGLNQSACAGDSVMIGTTAVGGFTYSWSPATGLSSSTIAQPNASPSVTTTYTLTVTNSTTGCSNTDVVVVTVAAQPTADAGPDRIICAGDSISIGTAFVSGNTYSWSPVAGLSSATVAQPNASPAATTTYTLIVTNSGGCSATDAVVVTVNPAPNANAGTGGTICKGDSVQIGAPPVAGNTYSWSPATGLSSSTSSQTYASPSTTTTYTLTETIGSCSTTNTVTVVVQSPTIYAGADQMICDGSGGVLGSPAVANYTYLWTPSTGLSSSTVAQPTANPGATTVYTLVVTDTLTGCTATDQVLYTIGEEGIFNAFSPNGDGTNDWWKVPMVECYGENEVIIINRWGNEVWKGTNYNNTDVRWNGQNMNGVDVTDGTYYYIIKYNNTESRGWVFIKR